MSLRFGKLSRRPLTAGIVVGLVLVSAACSVLLDKSADQCSTDGDCARFAAGAICQTGICVRSDAASSADGNVGNSDSPVGSDGAPSNDSAVPPTDGPPGDGGLDAPEILGPDGCFPGVPATNDQFMNACTNAVCIPYDNCAHLGLCGDAAAPPLVDPPDAGSSATDAGGSPPTELCYDPGNGQSNVVYITGSTNFTPFVIAVAPILAAQTTPYTIVWQATNSCNGVETQFNADPNKHLIKDKVGAYASYYKADGTAVPCLLDPAGNVVDVGQSDVYSTTCNAAYVPAPGVVAHYIGPIQSMTLIVPGTSSQRAISAEAARQVFGMGGGDASPWNVDPTLLFVRASSTGTNQLISKAIEVPPTKWWGVDKKSAGNMRDQLKQVDPAVAENTIGTLSMDFADSERGNLHMLAFQAKGQLCGFLPDKTAFTRDKQNLRDGHYPIWGPMHFYTRPNGQTPSPQAGALVTLFSEPRLDKALLDAVIGSGNVPQCAMRVTRDVEMGPIKPYTPNVSCSCYFDSAVNGTTTCKTCTAAGECPSDHPACNLGFCEAQ